MLLYALTILVSAFLLFQVQPMIAKIILPWFGGSAAVWSTCLLFFQCVLLLGYGYAYWLTNKVKGRMQSYIHIALLAASLLLLPILPGAQWKPSGAEDPLFRILGLLAATVGLPYFLLSTTGPLIQAWYTRRYEGAVPYRLYALSNAGSMFALLSYPILFEPYLATRQQAIDWSVGYVVFAILCSATGWIVSRHFQIKPALETPQAPVETTGRPKRYLYFLWIGLPACASILLLAITNHLTQNVAAIPFLWVLPLSLYLLTFIATFDSDRYYRRGMFLRLFAVATLAMAYSMSGDFANNDIRLLIPLFSLGFLFTCMVCHGELVRLKPDPRYLTSFYLMISIGGAIGGIFVALLAPHIFRSYFELPVGLVLTGALVIFVLATDPNHDFAKRWKSPYFIASVALWVAMVGYLGVAVRHSLTEGKLQVRNFYGELKITEEYDQNAEGITRKLTHGTINHGEEFMDPARVSEPTTYYGQESGVGLAIRTAQRRGPVRVGVIGLGTGTLSSYGREGDYYRIYEINPLVIEIAQRDFFYLKNCKAQHEIALGDARLSLEREAQQNYDVLAVDAFSSDSIPVHLLTKEAFQLYERHLKPNGILAVHVSNRYLNLQPVVRKIADSIGKQAREFDTEDDESRDIFGATWVLVANDSNTLTEPLLQAGTEITTNPKQRLWTDDYSNLFQILK